MALKEILKLKKQFNFLVENSKTVEEQDNLVYLTNSNHINKNKARFYRALFYIY